MQEYRGILKRVGGKDSDMIVGGNVRVSGLISVIEIGDTVLRRVGCSRDIYDLLDPGEEAILYVHWHFFRTPVVLGVKYPATGRKFTMGVMGLVAGAVKYLVITPMLILIGGVVSTMFLGNVLGALLILAGLGLCLYNAGTLLMGGVRLAQA